MIPKHLSWPNPEFNIVNLSPSAGRQSRVWNVGAGGPLEGPARTFQVQILSTELSDETVLVASYPPEEADDSLESAESLLLSEVGILWAARQAAEPLGVTPTGVPGDSVVDVSSQLDGNKITLKSVIAEGFRLSLYRSDSHLFGVAEREQSDVALNLGFQTVDFTSLAGLVVDGGRYYVLHPDRPKRRRKE